MTNFHFISIQLLHSFFVQSNLSILNTIFPIVIPIIRIVIYELHFRKLRVCTFETDFLRSSQLSVEEMHKNNPEFYEIVVDFQSARIITVRFSVNFVSFLLCMHVLTIPYLLQSLKCRTHQSKEMYTKYRTRLFHFFLCWNERKTKISQQRLIYLNMTRVRRVCTLWTCTSRVHMLSNNCENDTHYKE